MIVNRFFSPDDRNPLEWDESQSCYFSNGRQFRYERVGPIPVLLPQNAADIQGKAAQHEQFDSAFHYLDHYRKDAELFDYFVSPTDGATLHEHRRLHETIIQEIDHTDVTILDVGCGNAWLAGTLCPKGAQVCSFDVSLANTQKALQKYPFDNHQAVVGDVFHLPFGENTFDYIVAAEIIEHLVQPALFIENLLRVLKPGGKIIITTPYDERIVYYLCIHCNRPTPQHAHLHSFDEKGILALVPSSLRAAAKTLAFSNKVLLKLRTHILNRYLPLSIWRWVDAMANRLIGKPTRLLLVVKKG